MKVIRKFKKAPKGSSLSVSLQYGVSDIKSALLEIKKRNAQSECISMKVLIQMLCDFATDKHMPQEPRQYIAEWMARRAIIEGFVFKANEFLDSSFNGEETYLIDEETIREKMRGRKPKVRLEI